MCLNVFARIRPRSWQYWSVVHDILFSLLLSIYLYTVRLTIWFRDVCPLFFFHVQPLCYTFSLVMWVFQALGCRNMLWIQPRVLSCNPTHPTPPARLNKQILLRSDFLFLFFFLHQLSLLTVCVQKNIFTDGNMHILSKRALPLTQVCVCTRVCSYSMCVCQHHRFISLCVAWKLTTG